MVPLCNCGISARKWKVKKDGPNRGRWFYSCSQPIGSHKCKFFEWVEEKKTPIKKEEIHSKAPACVNGGGAMHKDTGLYTMPQFASKTDLYCCPGCDEELVLCRGKVRQPYFRHKVDSECRNLLNSHPETFIHKCAKDRIKYAIENNPSISMNRICSDCKEVCTNTFSKESDDRVVLEHRFYYDSLLRIADVACIRKREHTYSGNNDFIVEVCNTHVTRDDCRPEPWFEVDASTIVNTPVHELSTMNCIREYKCSNCILKDAQKISKMPFERVVVNDRSLDLFVRYRLGQRVFRNDGTKQDHERFNHDARDAGDDIGRNDSILSIFQDLFDRFNVKVVLRSHKGSIAYVISNISEEIDGIDPFECGYNDSQGTCWFLTKILKEIVTHNESDDSSYESEYYPG